MTRRDLLRSALSLAAAPLVALVPSVATTSTVNVWVGEEIPVPHPWDAGPLFYGHIDGKQTWFVTGENIRPLTDAENAEVSRRMGLLIAEPTNA